MFLKIPSYSLKKIFNLSIFLTPWQSEDKNSIKETCREQDSNLGYCGHKAVSWLETENVKPIHIN